MEVWEMINQIKGTTATMEEIHGWMVVNRVCPLIVDEGLEEGPQEAIVTLASKHCGTKGPGSCGPSCYKEFLCLDMPDVEATP